MNSISQLRAVTFRMGSHSVTCHLTQLNTPHRNPSQRPIVNLCAPEGWKAELT